MKKKTPNKQSILLGYIYNFKHTVLECNSTEINGRQHKCPHDNVLIIMYLYKMISLYFKLKSWAEEGR